MKHLLFLPNRGALFMSETEKSAYRVHLEGLTATERTVFAGLIQLTEGNATQFQIETVLENADVVVLDGSVRRSKVLSRLNSRLAQRTIWIDPPADFPVTYQVSRPLRWTSVMEMMEKIVGANPTDLAVVVQPQGGRQTLDQLCTISQDVLRQHIGIAADFLVKSARSDVIAAAGSQAKVKNAAFLEELIKQLPASADTGKIADEISKALARAVAQ